MRNLNLIFILGISFFAITFQSLAQDTIFYKTPGSNIVVLIKEVSQTEVQYKKTEMPDGPMYIINKSDIAKIVYKNGYTEVMKEAVTPAPINSNSQPFTVTYAPINSTTNEKITYSDTKRRYKYVVDLIDRHPNAERRPVLMSSLKSMRGMKAGQDATRTIAIVFGGVTIATGLLTGLLYLADAYSADSFSVVPIAFGTVALVSTAASVAFHINLKKKRHAFVDLYNR